MPKGMPVTEIGRRSYIEKMLPVEKSIWDAGIMVESAGCDTRLTKAGSLLMEARNLVGDFIDGINPIVITYPPPLKRGDCVRLKGGSPIMTVVDKRQNGEGETGEVYKVAWIDDSGAVHHARLFMEMMVKVAGPY